MTVPEDAGFTCMEGPTRGCPSMGQPGYDGCGDANFTCTIMEKEGYTCSDNMGKTYIACSKSGGYPFQPLSGGACINKGYGEQHIKDSEIAWVHVPKCHKMHDKEHDKPSMTCGDLKKMYKEHNCCGNPMRRLNAVISK